MLVTNFVLSVNLVTSHFAPAGVLEIANAVNIVAIRAKRKFLILIVLTFNLFSDQKKIFHAVISRQFITKMMKQDGCHCCRKRMYLMQTQMN